MIRLLIVDDHKLMRSLMERLLRKTYDVTTAANGEQALEFAYENPFDVIYLDLRMPILDGVGTLKRIRSDESLRETPVVILSGCTAQAEMATARRLGISGSLSKNDVTLDSIIEMTSRVLGERSANGRLRFDDVPVSAPRRTSLHAETRSA